MSERAIEPKFELEKYRWFKRYRSIDLLRIDEEIQEMPVLIQEAGEIVAAAIEIRETAKEDFEIVQAQIAEQLRNQPLSGGKTRSETMIESQIPMSEAYKEKLKILSDARLDASLWMTMIESLRGKNSNIRVAADLLNSGFMTSDSIMSNRRAQIRKGQAVTT